MLAPLARGRSAVRAAPWQARWLALCALPAVAALIALATSSAWDGQLLLPLLAVPPALAGIGAATPRLPLAYGAVMLLAAIAAAPFTTTAEVPAVTAVSILVVTLISASGGARGGQENQRLADVTSVAEAAQRALLRPLPRQVGPLELGVVYLAAAAEARVGGDLYEVTRTQFGIRLIVGDVRGKGLDAVEIAADVLGVFREVAHEVYTLAEVARRIDASLARRPAAPLEEFVTAVLAEIDPAAGSLTIYNCGHPPPLVLSPGGNGPAGNGPGESDGQGPARRLRVTPVNVPAPALPLRLMSLGDTSGAERTVPLQPGDALLLYTDGVTEARNARREFYPLEERVAEVAARAGGADGDLLDRLRDDLVRYVGAPLDDDAALVLARVSGPWDRRAVPPPLAAAPQP
ncbi:MAG TPA: PP2C family protein-serine/threonine phosphatase [Streptosporangiaceae bacterium]|nr:PP2C family protein-serine/threonine phosphatase [Streptosporangiaceae bacterium]